MIGFLTKIFLLTTLISNTPPIVGATTTEEIPPPQYYTEEVPTIEFTWCDTKDLVKEGYKFNCGSSILPGEFCNTGICDSGYTGKIILGACCKDDGTWNIDTVFGCIDNCKCNNPGITIKGVNDFAKIRQLRNEGWKCSGYFNNFFNWLKLEYIWECNCICK